MKLTLAYNGVFHSFHIFSSYSVQRQENQSPANAQIFLRAGLNHLLDPLTDAVGGWGVGEMHGSFEAIHDRLCYRFKPWFDLPNCPLQLLSHLSPFL